MGAVQLTQQSVKEFEQCMNRGGIAVFPTDTLYGIACAADNWAAAERIYDLKGRPEQKPSAVMFFSLGRALHVLDWLDQNVRNAVEALLPGSITVVVPNPQGAYGPASGGGSLGIRVPKLEGQLQPLQGISTAVLQSSANLADGPAPASIDDIPDAILNSVDLALDGGSLAGKPSTVVSLLEYPRGGSHEILREGAVSNKDVVSLLDNA